VFWSGNILLHQPSKFELLRQPEAADCSPDHNGQGSGLQPAGLKLAAPGGYFYYQVCSGLVLQFLDYIIHINHIFNNKKFPKCP